MAELVILAVNLLNIPVVGRAVSLKCQLSHVGVQSNVVDQSDKAGSGEEIVPDCLCSIMMLGVLYDNYRLAVDDGHLQHEVGLIR